MTTVHVEGIESVGQSTVALTLATPPEFSALPGQFVLVRATVDGEAETGYYTLSSPNVEDTFEVTVAVDPDGTLGPWLAERDVGDEIEIEGPYGDVAYAGETDAVVLASGPGIGPAIGIGERAVEAGREVTIVYGGRNPPHGERLEALEAAGASVTVRDALGDSADRLRAVEGADVFVFGFEGFVEAAEAVLAEAGVDPSRVAVESFGPE